MRSIADGALRIQTSAESVPVSPFLLWRASGCSSSTDAAHDLLTKINEGGAFCEAAFRTV
jgi:hypothetical protein